MTRPASDVALVGALWEQGYNKLQIARMTGIPRATLRGWLAVGVEARLARAPVEHNRDQCPLIADVPWPAYGYLLGLYLGDGCISSYPRDVFRLRIFCCDAYPHLMDLCEHAIAAVMPTNRVGRAPGLGCTDVGSLSKHWPCLFPQHGPGMKHLRRIALAGWQEEILEAHPDLVLRGLIHSDGCRAMNRIVSHGRPYASPRYLFSNQSTDIIGICTRCLDLLGVEWRMNRPNSVSIARRASVATLDRFIGPKT